MLKLSLGRVESRITNSVELTYHTKEGRYIGKGRYDTYCKDLQDIVKEVDKLRKTDNLPGVSLGRWCGYIYILPDIITTHDDMSITMSKTPFLLQPSNKKGA